MSRCARPDSCGHINCATLTVGELLRILSAFPPDAKVVAVGDGTDASSVRFDALSNTVEIVTYP